MRKEKGGKRGRKKMDDREKESEAEERVEVAEELIERRRRLRNVQLLRKLWSKKKRGLKKI